MKVTLSLNPQGEVVVDLSPEQSKSLGIGNQPIPVELTAASMSSSTDEDFEAAMARVMERHHGLFAALSKV